MRQADRAADDVRLGQRRVVHARAAELLLQSPRHLEDAALALDLAEVLFARHVGDVLAEHEDLRVAPHLVLHAGVEQIDHRRRRRPRTADRPRCRTARWSDRRRASRRRSRPSPGRAAAARAHRRSRPCTSSSTSSWIRSSSSSVACPSATSHFGNCVTGSRAASASRSAGGRYMHLVVRQRMRVGTDHLRVHERRPLALRARSRPRLHQHVVARERNRSRPLPRCSRSGNAGDELGDPAAGRVDLDRNRDRVAVVLDQVDDRQLEVARRCSATPRTRPRSSCRRRWCTSTTSSFWKPSVNARAASHRSEASAQPTACRNCVPVGDDARDDVVAPCAPSGSASGGRRSWDRSPRPPPGSSISVGGHAELRGRARGRGSRGRTSRSAG